MPEPTKTDPKNPLNGFQFELEMAAYRYTLRVVLYLVIPLLGTLLGLAILQRYPPGIAMFGIVVSLNLAVLLLDRTRVSQTNKIRINRLLFKTQVFASGAFLLFMIAVAGQWGLVPWTFVICYLAFVITGLRAGVTMTSLSGLVLLGAYLFTPMPDTIPLDNLIFRYFPAFTLMIILFAGVEHIRKDYRRKLAKVNLSLTESKERYRRLYEKMVGEASERKQAEDALLGSEERFRLIAENVADVIWITDMELNFTYVSPSIVRQRGFPVEEALQQSVNEVLLPDYQEMALTLFAEKLALVESGRDEGFESVEFEVEQPCKDGSVIWTSNHARFLTDPDRKAIGILGITRDITERKQAEEKLARSKKMESLGLLAGGVAHDLNNILSGIVSYPELLLMDLPPDSKLKGPIETIQASGHRAAAIVQDLLTVARGVAVAKEPVNLNALVADYLKSPELIRLKQAHLAVIIESRLQAGLLDIIGSQVHLRKVVMNLVANAAEALQGNAGRVVIATENRYLDNPLTGYANVDIGEYVVLSVSDNGPGISPDDRQRIFEPFYTKKAMGRSGTGLGLAVVWNTVQDHKGYIDLLTESNRTVFELYFPITREVSAKKDAAVSIGEYRGNGQRILVVDDEPSQREISCRMLETLGYEAAAVPSGEQAVTYMQHSTADLLLLDMIMAPGINGRETYAKILEIRPHQRAVIISGFAKNEEVQLTQALGAGKYVKKPLTLKRLGVAVKEELSR